MSVTKQEIQRIFSQCEVSDSRVVLTGRMACEIRDLCLRETAPDPATAQDLITRLRAGCPLIPEDESPDEDIFDYEASNKLMSEAAQVIARLREKLSEARKANQTLLDNNYAKNQRLRAERDALAKDAKRLDWLDRDDIQMSMDITDGGQPFVEIFALPSGKLLGRADNIRAAIDAAKRQK